MTGKTQDDDFVTTLVDLAMARPSEERARYLQAECGNNTDLLNRVWHIVQSEEQMKGFIAEPVVFPVSSEHPFKVGELLQSRFRIVREIARGGMGIVYEAMDEKLERRIALKAAKAGFNKRLPPEVRNASEISHPNVCKIFEIHTATTPEGDIDFITMEFLEGETLSQRLHRGIGKQEARAIARQICAGLSEAHRNKVVHGDLKSNNVILTTEADGTMRAVITDFGLARGLEAPIRQQPPPAAGTPAYMAPELWTGHKASFASDVYALGVILNELLLGQLPQGAKTTAIDWSEPRHVQRRPRGWHRKWDRIITRCLDPDPSRRFKDAAEIARALAPSRSRRLFIAAAAAIVLAIVSSIVTYQNAKAPQEVVRLAVLPFEADAATKALSEGLLLDTGNRLSNVKPGRIRLTLVPLSDALQNKVDQPAQARTMLGATISLSGKLRKENGRTIVNAYLTDTRSLVHLAEWHGEYAEGELPNMPVALAGMVTGTLRLPPLAAAVTVNAAAYPDYATGVSLARRGADIDRAISYLERALAADPMSPLTHASLAEAEFMQYRLTKDSQWKNRAFASLQQAEQRNPDVAAVRFVSGMINDDEGHYEQAEADFLRVIELEPTNGDAWRRLGDTYRHDSQPNRELESYVKAIDVQPEYYRNYQDLGEFYFNRGDYQEAATQYKKIVDLVPDLSLAHYLLATPYLNMGLYAEAERELKIAIGLKETAVELQGLGLLRMYQNRDREAIPYVRRALEIGPKTSLLYLNLGTALRRAGLITDSEEAYQTGLDLAEAKLAMNPRDAYERVCLAYLCARLGERRRAEAETAQALQLSRDANNVRWMAALTYEAMGLHDRTMAVIEDAPDSLLSRLYRFPDLVDLRAFPRFQELTKSRHIQ
jgi:eukaryotic-like serine/threonine-protein kinase